MRLVRMVYLRNEAFSWRFHEDLARLNTYRIEVMVPSWSQYVLQAERLTKAENIILERARSFQVGSTLLSEQMFLCVNRELHSKNHKERKGVRSSGVAKGDHRNLARDSIVDDHED